MCSKHSASQSRVFQIFRDYMWLDAAVHGVQQPRGVAGRPPQAPGLTQVGLFVPRVGPSAPSSSGIRRRPNRRLIRYGNHHATRRRRANAAAATR